MQEVSMKFVAGLKVYSYQLYSTVFHIFSNIKSLFQGLTGSRGLPGRPAPLQKLRCATYTSHSNIKYSSFVRCPFLGHQIVSCSCRSSRRRCSKRHSISGNICRCACKRARPTAVCCRLARVYKRKG